MPRPAAGRYTDNSQIAPMSEPADPLKSFKAIRFRMWDRSKAHGYPTLEAFYESAATTYNQAAMEEERLSLSTECQQEANTSFSDQQLNLLMKAGANTFSRSRAPSTLGNRRTSIVRHWIPFSVKAGLPVVLFLVTADSDEVFWAQTMLSMFHSHLKVTMRSWDGPGLALHNTIHACMNMVLDAHWLSHRVDLSVLKQHTQLLADGRKRELVLVRGVRGRRTSDALTSEMKRDFRELGWLSFGGRKNPALRAAVLQFLCSVASAGGFRPESVVRTSWAFDPQRCLSRRMIKYRRQGFHEELAPAYDDLVQLYESHSLEGDIVPPPNKSDPDGSKWCETTVHLDRNLQIFFADTRNL